MQLSSNLSPKKMPFKSDQFESCGRYVPTSDMLFCNAIPTYTGSGGSVFFKYLTIFSSRPSWNCELVSSRTLITSWKWGSKKVRRGYCYFCVEYPDIERLPWVHIILYVHIIVTFVWHWFLPSIFHPHLLIYSIWSDTQYTFWPKVPRGGEG